MSGQVVSLRREPHDPRTVIEVTLTYTGTEHIEQWSVEYEGRVIGTVGRYTGSLDRKTHRGLLRVPGKPRTLWSACGAYAGARTINRRLSRADALRWLLP